MQNAAIVVTTPSWQERRTSDPELAAVIAHEPPPKTGGARDLDAALGSLRSKSAEREERFRQQMQAESQKGKLLDRKFQEGLKKAKDSPDPPPRPSDFD